MLLVYSKHFVIIYSVSYKIYHALDFVKNSMKFTRWEMVKLKTFLKISFENISKVNG